MIALQFSYNAPILPHLRRLHWTSITITDLHSIMLFLHPGIARLRLTIPVSHSAVSSTLLSRLHALCPDVRDFHLEGTSSYGADYMLRLASAAPVHWPNLHSLCLPHLTIPDLQQVASLPKLRNLYLSCPMNELEPVPTFDAPAFSALRALEVQPISMTYGSNLLMAIPSTLGVERFRIMCHDAPKDTAWPALFKSIAHAFDPEKLHELLIEEFGDYEADEDGDEEPRSLAYETMQSIIEFPNLTILSVHCWGGFFVTDEDFLHLAQSLPLIEKLALCPGRGEARAYHATILGLVHLARHCPRLESLDLDFSADDLCYEESLALGICQRRLANLEVFFSPIRSARVVAAFLSAIFPNIVSIESATSARVGGEDDSDDEEGEEDEQGRIRQAKWDKVADLMPIFRFVRLQERKMHAMLDGGEAVDADEHNSPLLDEDWDTDASDM
ncbi:hypothetical protein K523DRAFT_316343 [Schizophyllum commune Tattone D]|nr:hypothetical protein K523DRAFT_316343 [Schizophyllum commune Tattone D]